MGGGGVLKVPPNTLIMFKRVRDVRPWYCYNLLSGEEKTVKKKREKVKQKSVT